MLNGNTKIVTYLCIFEKSSCLPESTYMYISLLIYLYILFQETHIIYTFPSDFYGSNLKVCVAGYLRPEKNFTSLGNTAQVNKNVKMNCKPKLGFCVGECVVLSVV